ncbi:MAG: beta-propeller fold lactonase family protein [Nitrospinota bacterium]
MSKKGLLALILLLTFILAGVAEAVVETGKKTEIAPIDQRDWQVVTPGLGDAPLRDYAFMFDAGGLDGMMGVTGVPSMKIYRTIMCGVDLHNFPWSGSNAGNTNGTPDGKYLYVSDKGADCIVEVNVQTGYVERILANPKPFGIHHTQSMSPNGRYVFSTGELTGRMQKMRLSDGATTVLEIPPAPSSPDYPDATRDGKYVFSGNYYHSAVMVFSQDPFRFIKEIPVGKNPHGTNVEPRNRWVTVCDKLSATASYIDIRELKVHKVIPVAAGPLHNQHDSIGKYHYQSCFVGDSTSKMDMDRQIMVDEFPIHYRVGHSSMAVDNAYYFSLNKYSTGLFNPTGIVYLVNFEMQDIDELSPTYGKTVKLIPIHGEPHEARTIFATTIQRWNTGKGEEMYTKGYYLGDVHVTFDDPKLGKTSKERAWLLPQHFRNAKRYFTVRDDGKPGVTKVGDVYEVRLKNFSYGYVPRFVHVPKGAKVRVILTNLDKAAGLTKNPDVTMGWTVAGYYGGLTSTSGVRGMSAVAEFVADKAGEFEFYCQHFCGPLHLEMRGTFFVDPPGGTASLAVGDYDDMSTLHYQVAEFEQDYVVGGNKVRNTLNEGNEPSLDTPPAS